MQLWHRLHPPSAGQGDDRHDGRSSDFICRKEYGHRERIHLRATDDRFHQSPGGIHTSLTGIGSATQMAAEESASIK